MSMQDTAQQNCATIELLNERGIIRLVRDHRDHYFIGEQRVIVQATTPTSITLSTEEGSSLIIVKADPFWSFVTGGSSDGALTFQQVGGLVGVSATTIKKRILDKKILLLPSQPDRISLREVRRYILYRSTYPHGHHTNNCKLPEDTLNSEMHRFSPLKRVEKERELQPPPAQKVYHSNPKRSTSNKDNIERSAVIDETGTYRYWLERLFPSGQQLVTFVLLNPSRADATRDDTTVTRCMRMAQLWGYQRLVIVNLFAFRTTYPSELLRAEAPIGPENGVFLLKATQESDKVVLGWGMHGSLLRRDQEVLELLSSYQLHCLGITKGTQQPKHPSRLAYATPLVPYLRHEGANERDQLPRKHS